MYKQLIILREQYDNGYKLDFGKGCAMAAHASINFLMSMIEESIDIVKDENGNYHYEANLKLDKDLYEGWFNDIETKIILKAKNKSKLMKAIDFAKELGLEEDKDYFIIADYCKTKLKPEYIDKDGNGRTIVGIGFKPMETWMVEKISKHYQLYQ